MADTKGYIKRSRLVMAQYLGRCLNPIEEVHHEDEVRENDSIENLWLFPTNAAHMAYHRRKEMCSLGNRPINEKGQYIKGGYNAYSWT